MIPLAASIMGSGYLWLDVSDHADNAHSQARTAWEQLATDPYASQNTTSIGLLPHVRLIFNSKGAWAVETADPASTPDSVPLVETHTRNILGYDLSVTNDDPIPWSKAMPKGTTRITEIFPRMYGAICADHDLHVAHAVFHYAGVSYDRQLTFPDQCGDGNGLGGTQIIVNGQTYPESNR